MNTWKPRAKRRSSSSWRKPPESSPNANERLAPKWFRANRPAFQYRGNPALLERPATAFLCSTQCPGDKILEAYGWARRQCDEGGMVISGFHTPVEKDVLAILARRGARILWVPARDMPKILQDILRPPMDEGRLIILSPFAYGNPSRPTRASCSARNRFVLARASARFIPHVAAESALAEDLVALPGLV